MTTKAPRSARKAQATRTGARAGTSGRIFDKETGDTFAECQTNWGGGKRRKAKRK
jgi:hypothetical protein